MVNLVKVLMTQINSPKFSCRYWGGLLALLISFAVNAEFDLAKVWVNAGFYSAHFETNKGLRNANPGLAYYSWTVHQQ